MYVLNLFWTFSFFWISKQVVFFIAELKCEACWGKMLWGSYVLCLSCLFEQHLSVIKKKGSRCHHRIETWALVYKAVARMIIFLFIFWTSHKHLIFVYFLFHNKKYLTSQQTLNLGSWECEVRRIIFLCLSSVWNIALFHKKWYCLATNIEFGKWRMWSENDHIFMFIRKHRTFL